MATDSVRSTKSESKRLCLLAPTVQDTEIVAGVLSADRQPGDCYSLFGSVGAGKSVFRWLNHALMP